MRSVDFNKVNTARYRVSRILSCPPRWVAHYRGVLDELSCYRTAIIFPEMILGLNQANLWVVCFNNGPGVTIKKLDCVLYGGNPPYKMNTYDEIIKFEEINGYSFENSNYMTIGRTVDGFHHHPSNSFFTGKEDAVMRGKELLEKIVKQQ